MKIGDRVIDIENNDEGVITGLNVDQTDYSESVYWVLWTSGEWQGETLYIPQSSLRLLEAPTKVQELHLVIKNCGDGSSTIQYVLDEAVLARMEELADEGDEEYASGDGLQVKTLCFPPDFDMEHFIASNKISVITLERLQ